MSGFNFLFDENNEPVTVCVDDKKYYLGFGDTEGMHTSEDTHRQITYGKIKNLAEKQLKADNLWRECIEWVEKDHWDDFTSEAVFGMPQEDYERLITAFKY